MRRHQYIFALVLLSSALGLSCGKDDDKKVNCAKSTLTISLDNVLPSISCSRADGEILVVVTGGK